MKPPWIVNKRQIFIRCIEKEKISQDVVCAIEAWAKDAFLVATKNFKLVHKSQSGIFQIWNARIPDPSAQRGKSGGFRLICFFVKSNNGNAVYLDLIEKRKALGFKNEHSRDKHRYDEHIKNLKKELMENYELQLSPHNF